MEGILKVTPEKMLNSSEEFGDNIYLIKNGVLYTPHTLNNLKGISRMVILEVAAKLGIKVEITDYSSVDFYHRAEFCHCSGAHDLVCGV